MIALWAEKHTDQLNDIHTHPHESTTIVQTVPLLEEVAPHNNTMMHTPHLKIAGLNVDLNADLTAHEADLIDDVPEALPLEVEI